MSNSESAQDRAPTTEQMAAAGTAGSADRTSPDQYPLGNGQAEQSASATQAAAGSDLGVGDQLPTQLLESRWAGGGEVSTEDLRRRLRRYRSFFERLLAA